MSFSRELLNEPQERTNIEDTKSRSKVPSVDLAMCDQKQETPVESCVPAFNGVDFGKFLSNEYPNGFSLGDNFLSKDGSLPSFDASSLFKSKDLFSKVFASVEWEMKYPSESPQSTPHTEDGGDKPKAMPTESMLTSARTSPPDAIFSSRDWMPNKTLGKHIDVPYSMGIFSGSETEPELSDSELASKLPQAKTDWDALFVSQLQLMPSSPSSSDNSVVSGIPLVVSLPIAPEVPENDSTTVDMDTKHTETDPNLSKLVTEGQSLKKKRKRKPRKKLVPEVKVYVEPEDMDVLLGRGGRSNHHPGNKRYREEVKNLKSWYLDIEDKDEKTDLSQCLVDYVKSYGGRFLEKEKAADKWYVVPNIVARRKASQALREDDDPEKRAAKRKRFLQKKAARENNEQDER